MDSSGYQSRFAFETCSSNSTRSKHPYIGNRKLLRWVWSYRRNAYLPMYSCSWFLLPLLKVTAQLRSASWSFRLISRLKCTLPKLAFSKLLVLLPNRCTSLLISPCDSTLTFPTASPHPAYVFLVTQNHQIVTYAMNSLRADSISSILLNLNITSCTALSDSDFTGV